MLSKTLVRAALFGACYLIAVPVGMAIEGFNAQTSVFWPAAGVALAGLLIYGRGLWPGLFVAALLGELVASGATRETVAFAALQAAGVTFQAWMIAFLIERFAGRPIRLRSFGHAAMIVAMAVPLGSVISASIGVLAMTGIPFPDGPPRVVSWPRWWLGDALGVATVVPLALFMPWGRGPALFWHGVSVRRLSRTYFSMVCASVAISLAGYVIVDVLQHRTDAQALQIKAQAETDAIHHQLVEIEHVLEAGMWSVAGGVTPAKAAWESRFPMEDMPAALLSVGYISMASHRAGRGEEHSQLLLGNPALRHDHGVPDIAELPGYGDHLDRAATLRNNLLAIIGPGSESGLPDPVAVMILPVFGAGQDSGQDATGWLYAIVSVPGLVAGMPLLPLAVTSPDLPSAGVQETHVLSDAKLTGTETTSSFNMFGEQFSLVWPRGRDMLLGSRHIVAYAILLFGLGFAAMLGCFLIVLAQQEAQIRAEVRAKTREIEQSTRETRSILDSSKAMIAVTAGDARILKANDACCRFFGMSKEELTGQVLCQLLAGRNVVSGADGDDGYLRADHQVTTVSWVDPKGRTLYLDLQIDTWQAADGEARKTYFILDVTEREVATQRLRRTQERFAIATDGTGIGVFDIDVASGESTVSRSWKVMMGFDEEAEIDAQAEWASRVHVDDLPMVLESDTACMNGLAPNSISEFRVTRADGQERWMRSHIVPVDVDEDGRARRMVGAQTDITDLRKSQEELKARENTLRRAIEGAGVAVALVDTAGQLTKANKALCEFAQCTEENLIRIGFLKFVHPDYRASTMENILELLRGVDSQFQSETCFRLLDGSHLWGLMSVALIRDDDGAPLNFIVQITDISERKEIERIKDEFVSTVSHELRTPLTSINGAIGLIGGTMGDSMPPAAGHLLDLAKKNCDRLILLVNDILDMEKLASGKLSFELAEADVVSLAAEAVRQNQTFMEEAGVRYRMNANAGSLFASVDQNRFQQVMANLLSNAVKYSPPKGEVEIEVRASGDRARVSVTDHGPGLPLNFRNRVFKAFSQADSSVTREKSGTGLGLYITSQIVERMGGTIGFDSEPDVATTFWFELPLCRSEQRNVA